MPLLLGTETEYGIAAPGRPDLDAHALSAAVVEACGVPATPVVEESRHRMLGNGGRFYVDHGHPEYCTPETRSASDALVWELAGDQVVAEAAARASAALGSPVRVYKNNTDGKGNSYGYHENYLLHRATGWEAVEDALPTLLVTRTLLAGAGRVGLGRASEQPGFQLSQRADFFERVSGLDTTQRRGIVNTRDEPHALPRQWRRLHVIAGDATRSPFATWLKLGVLGLLLGALEEGLLPPVRLADPVTAFATVSRDRACATPLPLADGRTATAADVQEELRDAAAGFAERVPFPEASEIITAWTGVLDDLRADPARLSDRLDWAAKLTLLEGYRARAGSGWDHPKLAQVDLAWAELGERGLAERLQAAGRLRPGPVPERVEAAMVTPPTDTRAHTRGLWVRDHVEHVIAAGWDSMLVRDSGGALHALGMPDPFRHTAAQVEASLSADRLARGHDRRDP
ncbi:MAG: proteasome accessory factor PafA2 family protein [Propionibacteriaceae bacterium]|nr:proteasome accessory factor PafA2 family protein [Propionibacteriaceae bacterium]